MLQDHYTTAFEIERKVVNGRKTTFTSVGTNFKGHIQPARFDYQLQNAGAYDKNYVLFTDVNVLIGDTLTIGDTKYTVHGVEKHDFRIGGRHIEAFIHTN